MSHRIRSFSPIQYTTNFEMDAKRRGYPNVLKYGWVKSKFFSKVTNSLTQAIKRYLELHGCYAIQIQSHEQWNPALIRFTESSTKKGKVEPHSVINSHHIFIKFKWRKVQSSDDHKKVTHQVQTTAGFYRVVKDYVMFWAWLEQHFPVLINQKGGELK